MSMSQCNVARAKEVIANAEYQRLFTQELEEAFKDDSYGMNKHADMLLGIPNGWRLPTVEFIPVAYRSFLKLGKTEEFVAIYSSNGFDPDRFKHFTWTIEYIEKLTRNKRKSLLRHWRTESEVNLVEAVYRLTIRLNLLLSEMMVEWEPNPQVPFKQLTKVSEVKEYGLLMKNCLATQIDYTWDCYTGNGVLSPVEGDGCVTMIFWKKVDGKWVVEEINTAPTDPNKTIGGRNEEEVLRRLAIMSNLVN